jgi:hypothetical protein
MDIVDPRYKIEVAGERLRVLNEIDVYQIFELLVIYVYSIYAVTQTRTRKFNIKRSQKLAANSQRTLHFAPCNGKLQQVILQYNPTL